MNFFLIAWKLGPPPKNDEDILWLFIFMCLLCAAFALWRIFRKTRCPKCGLELPSFKLLAELEARSRGIIPGGGATYCDHPKCRRPNSPPVIRLYE